ncbi:MAG: aldehyde dehydrogenase family protein [Spirochaetaceae bacterium]|nr:aldehyde dehydrogenase family protein [Spirochaetaceae bacterium]
MLTDIVTKARSAQKIWSALPYGKRAAALRGAAKFLASHIDDVTEVIHRDNGKLLLDALATEALPAILAAGYYIKQGKKFMSPRNIGGRNLLMFNKKSRMVYGPWGVIGIISPWNYPFAIPFSEVLMALLAGNGVILKTASVTPNVGRMLEKIFLSADLPDGLFTFVEIPGAEAGPAFIESGIDKLFFTGSTATGRLLMGLAAPRLLPLVLELGGSDGAIICADADLDKAAAGVMWAGFSNAGQSCGGIQRVLVHRDVYAPFLEKLCALTRSLRLGSGPDCDVGPMTSARQRDTAQKQIAECVRMGATVAARSPLPEGLGDIFLPAMVLTGVTADMPVMKDEIFGPVVAVVPVSDDDEAVAMINRSPYGLTGSVWSRSHRRAMGLAMRVNAGAVMVNDHLMSHGLAETPWGGFGDSGLGRTHGEMGFREMLKARVIVDETLPGVKRNLWWQPYSEGVYRGMRAITAMVSGGLGAKLRALPGVLGIFFRYWSP